MPKEQNQVKPEKTAETPKKRGTAVWKSFDRLGIVDKNPNYRYKWCSRTPENLEKKHAEGWTPVNRATGIPGEHREGVHAIDGVEIAGAKSHRELILHAMPAELAEARDRYFQGKTDQQARGLKKSLQEKVAGGPAQIHGKIVIE